MLVTGCMIYCKKKGEVLIHVIDKSGIRAAIKTSLEVIRIQVPSNSWLYSSEFLHFLALCDKMSGTSDVESPGFSCSGECAPVTQVHERILFFLSALG